MSLISNINKTLDWHYCIIIFKDISGRPLFCKRGIYEDIFVGMSDSPPSDASMIFLSIENQRPWIASILKDESKTDWKYLISENVESVRETKSGGSNINIQTHYLSLLIAMTLYVRME